MNKADIEKAVVFGAFSFLGTVLAQAVLQKITGNNNGLI